jgi:hypothetical protein
MGYRLDQLMGCSAGLVLAHQGSIGDAATYIYRSKGNEEGVEGPEHELAGCGSRLAATRFPIPFPFLLPSSLCPEDSSIF